MPTQTSNLLESIRVYRSYIELQFKKTLKVSTLDESAFSLAKVDDATPVAVSNPFKPTVIEDHYNSISRTFTLFFNQTMTVGQYAITIQGIKTATGEDAVEYENGQPKSYLFSYEYEPLLPEDSTPSDDPIIFVEDKSIQKQAFLSSRTAAVNPGFHIVKTDPPEDSLFVEEDFEQGRITIEFSQRPSPAYVSDEYIRVQKKRLGIVGRRWEKVAAQISLDPESPEVYIYLPSNDATPVFDTADKIYFEDGYKYRVRLSREIEDEASAEGVSEGILGEDVELYFSGAISPLFVDPEEFTSYYSEASLMEIAELVHRYSIEVEKLMKGEEPSVTALEYIRNATLCGLARIYDYGVGGDEASISLGDLSVSRQTYPRMKITRANAANSCELAAVLRQDLIRSRQGMKGVTRGSKHPNPMPVRHIRSKD